MPKRPQSNPPPPPQAEPPQGQAPDARRSGMGAVVLHHSVTALMMMLIIALAVWSYLSFRNTDFFAAPTETSRLSAYLEGAQKQRVHFALDVFYRLDGRYPLTLDELAERHLLQPDDLYYPSKSAAARTPFRYERTQKSYTLELTSPLPRRAGDEAAEPIF